ncbi:MAG TPA: glycoside hydrolase domain-containing protein [Candidatus Limnocylindrales bacterium]|nr:glycoside hydrolase domain-containing protein [Candidatus Limnocylindrales bacterium]
MKLCVVLVMVLVSASSGAQPNPAKSSGKKPAASYVGFDKNDYPGDSVLDELRKTFSFTGYWLNTPPGAKTSAWLGKRALLRSKGFGFVVLFNGKTYAQLKAGDAAAVGASDGTEATRLAGSEGFPARTIIFLDHEEGGRLLPEQRAYLHAWVDAVVKDRFRAGVYCSGIAAREGGGATVVTAQDIRENAGGRQIAFFVANDQCPPSPGCSVSAGVAPAQGGIEFADVWQYAQSPRRKQYTRSCAKTYAADGNCYAAGKNFVDLNVGASADPSHGR